LGRDDKSFVYLALTKEDFPRWEIIRQTDWAEAQAEGQFAKFYGPFDSKRTVEEILRFLRKIFPYHNRKEKTEKGCLDFQIGLCPGPHAGAITPTDYQKNIRAIELIFQGKRVRLERQLEREMQSLAKKEQYEKAAQKRNQLLGLRRVQRLVLISRERPKSVYRASGEDLEPLLIEGYDVSHISGKFTVGSLVRFSYKNGRIRAQKASYRRFKIRSESAGDDLLALKEVLQRRLKRANEWPLPDLFLIDGGKGQLKMAKEALKEAKIKRPILAVAKGPERKNLDLRLANLELKDPQNRPKKLFLQDQRAIGRVRDEAHRFAISYHRKIRGRALTSKR
jgi:excinuclease ABC subunit C